MPIGDISAAFTKQQRTNAERQAAYHAEERRLKAKWDFELFCKRQSTRVQRRLQLGVQRIQDARFSAEEGDEMTLVEHRRA